MDHFDSEESSSTLVKNGGRRKWRDWHEREIPVKVRGNITKKGLTVEIASKSLSTSLELVYADAVWERYPKQNKTKLVDNLTYIFSAHLPFLLKGNIRLDYNTGYPQVYSWTNQCFMRFFTCLLVFVPRQTRYGSFPPSQDASKFAGNF